MKQHSKNVTTLFLSMLRIGVIGFGGGSALIPVIEKATVERGKLLPEEELNKAVVVANVTPGALPVEIVTGVGRYADGMRGMLLCPLLIALPGAFFVVVLSALMVAADENLFRIIGIVARIVNAYVLFILARYVWNTVAGFKKIRERIICMAIIMLVFALAFMGVSTLYILLAAFAVLSMAAMMMRCRNNDGYNDKPLQSVMVQGNASVSVKEAVKGSIALFIKEMGVWVLFLALLAAPAVLLYDKAMLFIGQGLISSILSFGGGDAYLAVAEGMFVDGGYISKEIFFDSLIPVVNAMPGSILCKTLTGVGFYYGYMHNGGASTINGLIMATAGFGASVAASGMTFVVGVNLYEKIERLKIFDLISRYIRIVVAGLLCKVAFSLARGIIGL